jgi:dihydrofolate synthase / folylpolyglutamate synthase
MSEKLSKSVNALFARTSLGIKPGLDVTTALLEKLGNPQGEFKVIHVAGTNGKGSVCAMIESVLRASGKKTGLYTSPHLFRFNERFRVNGQEISNADLEKVISDVEAAAQSLDSRPATFFELSTAIAFEHFKRSGVQYAVVETGMGGRWDATNVVQPVISVITRIALDHADYLGDDIEKVAWEKAGIIKEGVPTVCGPMPVEAESVVYKEAAEKNSPIVGSEEAAFFQVLESRRTDQLVDIEASGQGYRNVRLALGGSYQLENCGIAVATLEDLSDLEGIRLQMKKGLEAVKWPGRFQTLSMKPPILFDCAHNPNAAETLSKTLEEVFPKFENGFVVGFMKDKDVAGILAALASSAGKVWAVTLPGDRAMSADQIVELGQAAGLDIEAASDFKSSRDWVESGKKRLLCFAGSLFLAEEIRKSGMQI